LELVENCCSRYSNNHLIRRKENLGVATAQNIGSEWAKDQGAEYIILFDQDSLPAPDLVAQLMKAYNSIAAQGENISAVGPVIRDVRTATTAPFIRIGWFGTRRIFPDAEPVIAADFLISSGMLCSIETFQPVGLMREELFIDHVDTDWFLRAGAAGYNAWGVRDATMHHSLGEEVRSYSIFKGRLMYMHKPFRYYYTFRNSINLYRKKYATAKWISGDIVRLCKILVVILFNKNRYECYKMIVIGLLHGLIGRSGRYRGESN